MKNLMKDNRGNTMVEILVGFVLIMILVAAFYGIIKLSSNMTMYSVDKQNDRKAYEENYYQNYEDNFTEDTVTEKGSVRLQACDKDGNVLTGSGEQSFCLNNARLIRIHEKPGKEKLNLNLYRLLYIK